MDYMYFICFVCFRCCVDRMVPFLIHNKYNSEVNLTKYLELHSSLGLGEAYVYVVSVFLTTSEVCFLEVSAFLCRRCSF